MPRGNGQKSLGKAAQRGCGASILADTQNPSGHCSWSSCCRLTLLHTGVLDQQCPEVPSNLRLFYDSIDFIAERTVIYLDVLSTNSVNLPSLNAMNMSAKAVLLSRIQFPHSLGVLKLTVVIQVV